VTDEAKRHFKRHAVAQRQMRALIMPGVLTHNLMPEDREGEPVRAPHPLASTAHVAGALTGVCTVHSWASYSDGSLRCTRCFAITYPQRRLF
jgi:hypothetical protein